MLGVCERLVYAGIPMDLAQMPTKQTLIPVGAILKEPRSDFFKVNAAVGAILAHLQAAKQAIILSGHLVDRLSLQEPLLNILRTSALPFTSTVMGKCVIDEHHPQFIGVYCGDLVNTRVSKFIREEVDTVLAIGIVWSDFNTGGFTAHLSGEKLMCINIDSVRVGTKIYTDVAMADVIHSLAEAMTKMNVSSPAPMPTGQDQADLAPESDSSHSAKDDKITSDYLFPRFAQFIQQGDCVIVETGCSSMGLAPCILPTRVQYLSQTLWGAIGWATPAAFGAAVANKNSGKRTVMFTGEGSHQMTLQEMTQFPYRGLKPIVFVIDNGGYTIERLLAKDPQMAYNNIPKVDYVAMMDAFIDKKAKTAWILRTVSSCSELERVLLEIENAPEKAAYVSILIEDPMDAPPMLQHLRHAMEASMYSADTRTHNVTAANATLPAE